MAIVVVSLLYLRRTRRKKENMECTRVAFIICSVQGHTPNDVNQIAYPSLVHHILVTSISPTYEKLQTYAVNPGYPRALKSSTDSDTMSFRGVAGVSPSSSSALFVSRLTTMPCLEPGSPRGTFGTPSSTAKSTYLHGHIRQVYA
jgi:hypothetical protein